MTTEQDRGAWRRPALVCARCSLQERPATKEDHGQAVLRVTVDFQVLSLCPDCRAGLYKTISRYLSSGGEDGEHGTGASSPSPGPHEGEPAGEPHAHEWAAVDV